MPPITMLSRSTVDAVEAEVEQGLADALARAVADHDPVRGVALVLAARRGRQVCSVERGTILWLLQRIEDPVVVPCLVGACTEPLPTLLEFLDPLPELEARAAALVVCALLLENQVIPENLVALFSRCAVGLGPFRSGPVCAALERLEHPKLRALAQRIRHAPGTKYFGTLEIMKRALAGDFDSALSDVPDNSQPVRRSEPKVGRNDPCPCGSGQKFKKCCQGKPEPKSYRPWVPPAQVVPSKLPLHLVVQLRPHALDSHPLLLLVEDLGSRGPVDLAEEALDELLSRRDCPHSHDEVVETFLVAAAERCPGDRLLRLADRLRGETERFAQLKTRLLAALRPQVEELDRQWVSLLDETEELTHLSLLLARSRPGLSLMLARLGVVQSQDEWDSELLLGSLTQLRTRLGLPPEDPIEEVWESLQDSAVAVDSDKLDPAVLALQKELAEARQSLRELEAQTRAASQLRQHSPVVDVPRKPPAPAPNPPDDSELKRLRERLQEVKALLRERNQERARLRQELKARESSAVDVNASPHSTETEGEPELLECTVALRPPLMPEWTRAAAEELRELPAPVARLALKLTGELAAGMPSTWQKTKPIVAVEGLHSIRLGIHHRMLFRGQEEQGTLVIHHLVSRSDHDRVVKQMAR